MIEWRASRAVRSRLLFFPLPSWFLLFIAGSFRAPAPRSGSIALSGQKFLVTAFKSAPERVLITSGVPVPLWWRSIPADYRTPLFQGIEVLPLNPDEGRTAQEQLDSVRSRTKRFLGLKPEDQELEVLRSVVRKEVERSRRQEGEAVQAAWKAAL